MIILLIIPGTISAMRVMDGLTPYKILIGDHNTYIIKSGETTAELTINSFIKLNFPTFVQVENARATIDEITITPELFDGEEVNEVYLILKGNFEDNVTFKEEIKITDGSVTNKVTLVNNVAYEQRFALWKIINTYNQEKLHSYSKLNEAAELEDVRASDAFTQISEFDFGMGGTSVNLKPSLVPDQYILPQMERILNTPLEMAGKSIRFGYGAGTTTKVINPNRTVELSFDMTPIFMVSDETSEFYSGPGEYLPFVASNTDPLMGFVEVEPPEALQDQVTSANTTQDKIALIVNFVKEEKISKYLKNRPRQVINLDKELLNDAAFIKAMLRNNKIPTKTLLFKDTAGKTTLLLKIKDEEWIYFDVQRKEIIYPVEENIIFEEPTPSIQSGLPWDTTILIVIILLAGAIGIITFIVLKFKKFRKGYVKRTVPTTTKQRGYIKYKIQEQVLERAQKGEIPLMPDEQDVLTYIVLTGGELNFYRAEEKLKYSIDLIRSIIEKLEEKGILEEIR